MLPIIDRWQLILIILFFVIDIIFLSVVTYKNEFILTDIQVIASFTEKILFDIAFIMFVVLFFKAVFKSAWPATVFIVFNTLLSTANCLLYYFGNTMVEKHHFSLITPYSVTSFVPWYGLLTVLIMVVVSMILFYKVVAKIISKNLYHQAVFYFLLTVAFTLINTSGIFVRKNDERLDKVIMGFRNAQLYYSCKNQFLSLIKDVVFPTFGEKIRKLSPDTESFVNDYNLFSDKFRIETEASKHRKFINELKLPIESGDSEDLGLAPFDRIIYIITESLSLKALPCYNSEIKTEFATEFFCSEKTQASTFRNLYTTGSPTLQGLTVTFNSHPNYKIQEPTGQRNSFPKLLEKNGYKSVFIRSASKYFANENLVFKNMGFSEIIGREDFYEDKNLRKYIYGWGVEDRILYSKTVEFLEKNRNRKIFLSVFGTDTHPPYGQKHYRHLSYPSRPQLKKSFDKNTYKWIKAVDNMDFDISNFLKELEVKGLFDEKTLIIISADHSCPLNNVSSKIPGHPKNNLARIPLIFLSKQSLPEINKDTLASQVDIAPTIFHLLGLKKPFGWWGESLFSKKRYPYAVGYEKGFVRINSTDYKKLINCDNPGNKSEQEFTDLFNTVFFSLLK